MLLNWITDEAETIYAQPGQNRFVLQQHRDLWNGAQPLDAFEFERTIAPFGKHPRFYAHGVRNSRRFDGANTF